MIASINGKIQRLRPTELILETNGVGYGLSIPFSTYTELKDMDHCLIQVFTYVREDQIKLFGFFTDEEKKFFEILLKISGIGPSMALAILSGMSVQNLIHAIASDNYSALTAIPGIGKAKAEKLMFELKRKLKNFPMLSGPVNTESGISSDAVEALISLGFDESKAASAVNTLVSTKTGIDIEELVKEALRVLSK
ncbi:MAG: Holliday junction branch migration protein RuvA [Spirochaetes bacterium]|nr:Holliday junction branch migration protein RuvA [Spirochaetota bacterium]